MSLSDEARAEVYQSGPLCPTGKWQTTLSPDDFAEFTEALDDPTLARIAIYRALRKRGHLIGYDSFKKHTATPRTCRCP